MKKKSRVHVELFTRVSTKRGVKKGNERREIHYLLNRKTGLKRRPNFEALLLYHFSFCQTEFEETFSGRREEGVMTRKERLPDVNHGTLDQETCLLKSVFPFRQPIPSFMKLRINGSKGFERNKR
jgi:hypothetical protein